MKKMLLGGLDFYSRGKVESIASQTLGAELDITCVGSDEGLIDINTINSVVAMRRELFDLHNESYEGEFDLYGVYSEFVIISNDKVEYFLTNNMLADWNARGIYGSELLQNIFQKLLPGEFPNDLEVMVVFKTIGTDGSKEGGSLQASVLDMNVFNSDGTARTDIVSIDDLFDRDFSMERSKAIGMMVREIEISRANDNIEDQSQDE